MLFPSKNSVATHDDPTNGIVVTESAAATAELSPLAFSIVEEVVVVSLLSVGDDDKPSAPDPGVVDTMVVIDVEVITASHAGAVSVSEEQLALAGYPSLQQAGNPSV
eukprot:CAMPEP_0202015200 /NCGR_PEP_ID=MMETSP0905-20130828/31321_1 /ASSEMBLY_ACC=CAM_ASM_000554 /TAXON_ID=420261 /ORGANISM="Thalassiosira antarctica, Strain CCMP982" /LENGTH=106 /DNA_ID=CAMNT_0048575289 /DNA_START=317 /DNA_END=637 /DNA_ORIENTATION=+